MAENLQIFFQIRKLIGGQMIFYHIEKRSEPRHVIRFQPLLSFTYWRVIIKSRPMI